MTYKNMLNFKMIILIVVMMILICLGATNTFATGIDTYGNLNLNVSYNELNNGYSGPDLSTGTSGDLFFRGSDDQSLLQFLLDFKYQGNLKDSGPSNFSANQYYFSAPLTEQIFLTGGKKYKKTGVGKFFNVSNRYDWNGDPTNILECDILSSEILNFGLAGNFRNASNWNQIQYSAFSDFSLNNFNMQNYFYFEGNRRYFIGLDMAYQLGGWQFYCESIFKSNAEQVVVIKNDGDPTFTDPVSDFKVKDLDKTTAITVGLLLDAENYSLTLEYLRNNEGYDLTEQANYINYADKYPDNGIVLIDNTYLPGRFAKNYLGVRCSFPKLFVNDLSMSLSALASFLDNDINNDYLSEELSLNLTYNIVQNFSVSFNAVNRSGGAYGELNRLNEYKGGYQLGFSYSF